MPSYLLRRSSRMTHNFEELRRTYPYLHFIETNTQVQRTFYDNIDLPIACLNNISLVARFKSPAYSHMLTLIRGQTTPISLIFPWPVSANTELKGKGSESDHNAIS